MPRVIVLLLAVVIAMAILLGLIVRVGVSRLARLDATADQPIPGAAALPATAPALPAGGTAQGAAAFDALHAPIVSAAVPQHDPGVRPDRAQGRELENIADPIVLPITTARLHGQGIHLQVQGGGIQNVGFWSKAEDSVEWGMDVPHAGKYHVEINYACNGQNGGGVYEMTVGKHHFTGTATPTGSWEEYQTLNVGDLTLARGRTRIVLKPLRLDPDKSLMNVRSVRLVPTNP